MKVAADTWRLSGAAVVLTGCGALLARPWLAQWASRPTVALIILFVGLGVVGVRWPLPKDPPGPAVAAGLAVALGVGAFVVARLVVGGRPVVAPTLWSVALNSLAAVAEEAFFRRLVFGLLVPFGSLLAVTGSAVAFAVVHVSIWGAWVLPLDLAAGLLLSWQRWASGRWSVPAITHVAANVLAVL